jgi:hypothetical protein
MAEGSLGIYRREAAAMYCLEESSHLHRLGLAKSVKLPISCISYQALTLTSTHVCTSCMAVRGGRAWDVELEDVFGDWRGDS